MKRIIGMIMPSNNWVQMEASVRAHKWEAATDWLSSLAMFEMLPALEKLGRTAQAELVTQAIQILRGRGWNGAAERIRWASDLVKGKSFPNWTPSDLPLEQIQDANRHLAGSSGNPFANAELLHAYQKGNVFFARGFEGAKSLFLMALNREKFEGRPVEHSPQLERAMVKLAQGGGIQIMRTFAPRNSFHGKLVGNKWVCSCMDVMVYAGHKYHFLTPKSALIHGVAKLIQDLPNDATYDFGFVRPVGGPTGSDPRLDVFFEVRTVKQIQDAFAGNQRPLSDMLEEAGSQIRPALLAKHVGFIYADGADHMHVRAYL